MSETQQIIAEALVQTRSPGVEPISTSARAGGGSPAGETAESDAQAKVFPLSFAQRRLWFIEQLQPGTAVYSLPVAWRLSGALNVPAFERSVNEIIRRHSAFRTIFETAGGEPAQRIQPFRFGAIPVADLSRAADAEAQAQAMIDSEVRAPFDLKRGPVFRARLFKLSDTGHIALFNAHHIVWDGWSINVFRRELIALYEAFSAGRPSPLADTPVQFAELAAAQKTGGESWNEPLNYWKRELQNAPALELPEDRQRPSSPSLRGAVEFFEFDRTAAGALREMARKHGATFFMVLLAAFKATLRRYTGQEDIVLGSAMAGRDGAETQNVIGFFVNALPLRTNLGGDPTFEELLKRVRDVTLGAYANQEIPFEEIIAAARPERHPADGTPLIRAILGFETGCAREWTMGGLRASVVEIETVAPKFDWTFLLEETDCGLKGRLEYSTDLFEAEAIKRFLQHFRTFLQSAAANPQRRISEVPLLTADERQKVLVEWNRTETDYERDACVHELFERQAEKNPDAVALVFREAQMTYGELNGRANRLAEALKASGVGPDTVAGVSMERSMDMIVALLAILKAGGAYMPLDAAWPRERIEFVLADAKTEMVLTQKSLRRSFEIPGLNLKLICADEFQNLGIPKIAGATSSGVRCSAGNLAYVLFTSGSTGRPKGVAVPHRGVARLVRNTNYLSYSANDVFLQFAPLSFDLSTFEIWGPLLNGGRLVIFPPHMPALEELGRVIRENKITTLWLTAGLFHRMVDEQVEDLRGVRRLLAGGDVLSVPRVLKALRELPGCEIINGYGPTENTTFTSCWRVPANWSGGRSVPIGPPVSNTRVFVLDENFAPAPIGVPGELCAGGDGLARGYLNRDELTAEKFVPNPFESGGQLYRTGDRARWLPDGTLEFLGRMDGQVKIRGFRVEPGEIEAVLAQHPAVRQAAVVAQKRNSEARLAACVVAENAKSGLADELRRFLKEKLPEFMVPSLFIFSETLPLNANGKVDRRALALKDFSAEPVAASEPPRNAAEETLAEIWRELLGRECIGIRDNFFQLGGHSLLAMQMAARIGRAFQIELPVRVIFEAPTIAALADAIGKMPRTGALPSSGIPRRIRPAGAKSLLGNLNELSDAQVETLLAAPELNEA